MRLRASLESPSRAQLVGSRSWWLLLAMIALGSVTISASEAQAQQVRRKFKDPIHVVQPKPVLQAGRIDLEPRLGYTFNDSLASTLKVGAELRYHFSERFYLGGMFDWYNFGTTLSGPTDTYTEVQSQTSTAPDTALLNWFGGLELGWVPIFGKFALFNSSIIYYDVALTLGGGFANSASVQLTTGKGGPALTAAMVGHVFLTNWLSLNVGVRDVSFFTALQGAESDSTLAHAVSMDIGVGFYFGSEDRDPEENAPSDD